MDLETEAETSSRRQRFGLVFGISLTSSSMNRKPKSDDDQKFEQLYSELCGQPCSFFSTVETVGKKWKWTEMTKTKPSFEDVRSCLTLQDVDGACEVIHRLLDELPLSNTFILDIICVCDKIPQNNIPATLYGLLRRATDWHGGKLTLVPLESADTKRSVNSFDDVTLDVCSLEELSIKLSEDRLQKNVFWRGAISFFDEKSKKIVDLSDFELSGLDGSSLIAIENLMNKNSKRLSISNQDQGTNKHFISRRLKIVSRCHLTTVPQYFFTKSRFSLRCLYNSDDVINKKFLDLANSTIGLIARLDFSPTKTSSSFMDSCAGSKFRPNTEQWKKWVLNGMVPDEVPCKDEALSNKPKEPIFFLIFDQHSSNNEKCCILLDQNSNVQPRGIEVMHDVLMRDKTSETLRPELPKFEFNVNVGRLKRSVDLVRQKMIETLKKEEPHIKKEELQRIFDCVFEQCIKYALSKVNVRTSTFAFEPSTTCDEVNDVFDEEANWEERRFLALLDHYTQIALDHKQRNSTSEGTMKPSGDFVVLEAKELLKLFDADGNAKKGSVLEPIEVPSSHPKSLKPESKVEKDHLASTGSWPGLLWTSQHDLYYNRDEKSESQDRDFAKLQQIYVGSRETVSTCNSQNSAKEPEVITKSVPATAQPQQVKMPEVPAITTISHKNTAPASVRGSEKNRPRYATSVVRKSPRKMSLAQKSQMAPPSTSSIAPSLKSQEDMFRQKLRNAVYTALESRGIDEKNALFRKCFKRLFDICTMYAQDIPAKVKNGGSTKQWLLKVAHQNSETVIDLETSLLD